MRFCTIDLWHNNDELINFSHTVIDYRYKSQILLYSDYQILLNTKLTYDHNLYRLGVSYSTNTIIVVNHNFSGNWSNHIS